MKLNWARIVATEDGVFMERLCPKLGAQSCKITSDYTWYTNRVMKSQEVQKPQNPKKSKEGCPKDCGLCQWHSAEIQLPVFSITNDCNLDCPICFTYNRRDKKYFKTLDEAETILDSILKEREDIQLINMTGGEPTLHPQLIDLIGLAKKKGIKRVTVNTNGIEISKNIELAEKLKKSGAHLVLSLDTFDPKKSVKIHGADITENKKMALQIMEKLNIPTTILPVCIKGINEEDVREIVNEYIKKDFIRSITIQNMTFTGLRGKDFTPREHITIDEIETLLSNNEDINREDFFTPGSYHPLCYSTAYYIHEGKNLYPLSKVLDDKTLSDITKNSYFLDPNRDFSRELRDGINRLWAEGEDDNYIKALRNVLDRLYPADQNLTREERNRLSEEMVKLIYIHPHMDEDNFDIDRVSRCGDIVPDESGQMVPACAYNLLYRQRDERYWQEEDKPGKN